MSDLFKTMVSVQPTADYAQALEVELPTDFYQPNSLWRISYTVTGKLQAGTHVHRRLQIGNDIVSQLTGTCHYPDQFIFKDSVEFPMYIDGLFDVQSVGVNATSPPSVLSEGKDIRTPLSASSDTVMSYADSPLIDRSQPVRLMLWAEPILSMVVLYVNGLSIAKIQ